MSFDFCEVKERIRKGDRDGKHRSYQAFYKVETSLTRTHNEVGNSRERIAAGKQSAHAGTEHLTAL